MIRFTLETDIKIEREWRSGLQTELNEEKTKVALIEKQLKSLKITEKVGNLKVRFLVTQTT